MAIRTYDILLDSYNSTIPEPIVGRQGDKNGAVTLHVTITDRGTAVDLTGQTVNLIAETANGTAVVADNAGVTLTDAVNGKFDYAIPNALWSEAGKITKAYFSLNDTDGRQTTYDLIFIVKKAVDVSQEKANDYIPIIDSTTASLTTLQAQIKQSNLFTQGQMDELIGSLTDFNPMGSNLVDKLNNEFYGRGINPSWYHTGGATVEQAMEQAIAVATEKKQPLILTEDYEMGSLTINDSLLIIGNGHTITTRPSDSVVDNFITIEARTGGTIPYVKIHNLNIKNTSNYNVGLFNNDAAVDLINFSIVGFLTKNIFYKKVNVSGYGQLSNITCETSPIGIDLQTTDIQLDRYHGYNCLIHINGVGGNDFLTEIHGWNWKDENKNWVDGSCLIKFTGSAIVSNVYPDSVETGFVLPEGDQSYTSISIQNVIYFLNKSVYPISAPKLFSNLDNYNGNLNVNGIDVDANGWHDDNGLPEVITGTIYKNRMNFDGLMNSGFSDTHNIAQKYSINPDFFKDSDSNQANVNAHTFIVQQGAGSVYFNGGLKARVPVGGKVGSYPLTDDVFKKIDTFVFQGSMINMDGTMLPLGIYYDKKTQTITIYNSSNSVYDGTWDWQMFFNSHAY